MPPRLLIAVMALALILAAVVGAPSETEASIPWIDARPGPANLSRPTPRYVPAVPPGAPKCATAAIALAQWHQPLNSATTVFGIEVRNVGDRTCALDGRPFVTVPERTETAISVVSTGASFGPPGFPGRGARFGLRPGGTAHAAIFNGYLCDPRHGRRYVHVLVGYGSKALRVRVSACRAAPGFLSVGPFTPTESSPEPKPLRWPLTARLLTPSSAVAGRTLHYRVELENTSSKPFRFPFCPTYSEGFPESHIGVLNCRPMATLGPGESVSFEMRLAVTPHFMRGRRTLVWTLADETLEDGVSARAMIEIERR